MSDKFILIAGPCSLESEEQAFQTAEKLVNLVKPDYFRAGIWKPRTRPGNFEGIGSKGLKILQDISEILGIETITEVGNANHALEIRKYNIKNFWIGARTVANPFSVQEIAEAVKNSDSTVFIKNPVYPDIELWSGAIERFLYAGVSKIYAIHRGFYPFEKTKLRNIPRWEIPIELARRFPDIGIICDPSHIAGNKEFIKEISQRAIDLNMNGLMIEAHINPGKALSDKQQQLNPNELAKLLSELNYRTSYQEDLYFVQNLENLREKIDVIDFQMIDMLEHRFKLVDEIGRLKKDNNVVILQLERWKKIIESRLNYANEDNVSKEFLLKILQLIHKESIQRQNNIMNK
jgi:chorismate mutase